MKQEHSEFIDYLESTLIPDLKNSGRDMTAEDFEKAVKFIRELDSRNEEYDERFRGLAQAFRKKGDEAEANDSDAFTLMEPKNYVALAYEACASSVERVIEGVVP